MPAEIHPTDMFLTRFKLRIKYDRVNVRITNIEQNLSIAKLRAKQFQCPWRTGHGMVKDITPIEWHSWQRHQLPASSTSSDFQRHDLEKLQKSKNGFPRVFHSACHARVHFAHSNNRVCSLRIHQPPHHRLSAMEIFHAHLSRFRPPPGPPPWQQSGWVGMNVSRLPADSIGLAKVTP